MFVCLCVRVVARAVPRHATPPPPLCTLRFNPLARNCRICKCKVHQAGSHYCNDCAYQKGICAMCGKKQVKK